MYKTSYLDYKRKNLLIEYFNLTIINFNNFQFEIL